ncbi:transposase [Microcoleus sp. AT9b-C3]|uniref:transposase n=1 Tax=Microcoleus sp. AT9b-C3 TaxID=2818629 RepID=UPI00403F315C
MYSCFGTSRGISFMDFTSLKVCHKCRIHSHKVFKNLATGTKHRLTASLASKVHLVVKDKGKLLNFMFTLGNMVVTNELAISYT